MYHVGLWTAPQRHYHCNFQTKDPEEPVVGRHMIRLVLSWTGPDEKTLAEGLIPPEGRMQHWKDIQADILKVAWDASTTLHAISYPLVNPHSDFSGVKFSILLSFLQLFQQFLVHLCQMSHGGSYTSLSVPDRPGMSDEWLQKRECVAGRFFVSFWMLQPAIY